ncbi:unnamed protein product [Penicillium nalgiovense]|uniref:Uncharacterized protein n=1 Tax=Penicillium nalgiovense TaxID=60175 RepID=A0A9W4N0S9_PENNA|nr:unnamed protein product [Penicillium nalgiovense]CAG7987730.1 unnamed protein product [Penicillium nalgiovense]CAG7989010.1 unnamed protein product [Penicillium nalgiovense]CAG7990367.1 unnamed protein product [Penicillium nalgiovense]CAG7995879.1 unnamed protein product [Penicillium nalgiovense]
MVNKIGLRGALSKLRKSPAQPTREPEIVLPQELVYPHFKRPVSKDSPIYSELMFPPTPLPTVPMASDSNLDPLVMASTISQARLNALQSGEDLDLFFQKGKDCIDAYAQAIKAMMEDASARVKNGEDPPFEEIEQMKERFFKYCQSIVEEALTLVARARAARHPQQTEVSSSSTVPSLVSSTSTPAWYEPDVPWDLDRPVDRSGISGALLASSGQDRLRLYTVSSDDWVMVPSIPSPTSPTKLVAPEHMDPVEESIHLGVIVRIFGKLYTMSKMMETIILYYGADPDNSKTGLTYWITRSEQNVRTQKIAVLIDVVENLYYALYARLTIELASIELCGSFPIDARGVRTEIPHLMPEADHLYRIVLAFKEVLDSPQICAILRKDILAYFQQAYIDQPRKEKRGLFTSDCLGYRQFAMRTVSCRRGSYCEKWRQLIPFFNSISAETMATLSGKYLFLTPRRIPPDDVPFDSLPWLSVDAVGMEVWDTDVVNDRHLSERAQINGTGMGDERKKEPIPDLYYHVRQGKCICDSICQCSLHCIYDVTRYCRCSERHVRIMAAKRGLAHRRNNGPTFAATASTIARKFFDGLAELKRDAKDTVIASELENAFEFFALLISNERAMTSSERSKKSS